MHICLKCISHKIFKRGTRKEVYEEMAWKLVKAFVYVHFLPKDKDELEPQTTEAVATCNH